MCPHVDPTPTNYGPLAGESPPAPVLSGVVLLAPDQRLGLVHRPPAEKPDVAAD